MKTDSQLKTDVLQELRSEPSLHVADITVHSHLGAISLSGTVKHYADKYIMRTSMLLSVLPSGWRAFEPLRSI